ncbi:hypothetical protein Aeqsu_1526 [Aequorivita sublithincola DSM 14238]|uniref:Uncharacterized protein n=1 Tax=Aequorivita sublithincola (strain DSM 14238 / LMG 21431 / ACAM 643 / 9-3) TaxID=746697 RepID=I3YVJ7_AEQSU|nr:hypothetical protein [Aequorivita sublithincola]AFL81015.1 hypothetical protein Aeqsu_1526 [Aequorivita sublithincola DSM 14238]
MKHLLLFILLTSFYTVSAQNDCEKFKNGTFKMSDTALNFACTITRNDSIQVEKVEGTDEESKFKVVWTNPCEYTLQMIAGSPDGIAFYKDKVLKVKIIATEENNYTYEANIDGIDFVAPQTIYKVE